MSFRPILILAIIFTICCAALPQAKNSNASAQKSAAGTNRSEKPSEKSSRELEAERLLNQRRANAQSLLINLAADARSFNDMVTRGRTLARIASVLWNSDPERARTMFYLAWDAAEAADEAALEATKTQTSQLTSGAGRAYPSQPQVCQEVIRLAARRNAALGEEFLGKLKEQMRRHNGGSLVSQVTPLGLLDPLVIQRLDAARQLLEADQTERAVQFADPVLGTVSQWTVDFLSSLRERNASVADDRYARMLLMAAGNPQSDANTVSVLASYLFTPHQYIGFTNEGTYTRSYPGSSAAPLVGAQLQLSFFRTAASILLRPLAPPGEEQNTSRHDGLYLMIKRLLPLFEQNAPSELTAALHAQLESLSPLVSKTTRDRDDDDWVRKGIRPDNMMENWEQSLRDKLDHAKTSDERDQIYLQLASLSASNGDLKARDFVDEVADPETRKDARVYVDIRLARHAVAKKDVNRMLDLLHSGELDHINKVRLLTQAAKLLAKTDNEKAVSLVDLAVSEARRISPSDADAPRAFLAAANATFLTNRSAVWETMNEAIKNANSAVDFTGEDGQLAFHLVSKSGPSYTSYESVSDFDLDGVFRSLADFDYDKTVELAHGLTRDAPRAVATLAIATSVLEQKRK